MATTFKVHRVWVIEKAHEELRWDNQVIVFDNPKSAAYFLEKVCDMMEGWNYDDMSINYYKEMEVEDYIDASGMSVWFDPKTDDVIMLDRS